MLAIGMALTAMATPLAASSGWTLEPGATSCTIQQSYGDGADQVVLGLDQIVTRHDATGVLVSPQRGDSAPKRGELKLSLGSREFDANYEGWTLPDKHLRVTKFHIEAAALEALRDAPSIAVDADDGVAVNIAPNQAAAAFGALGNCEARLLQSFGLDPAQEAKAATPAETTHENWLSYDNYPPDALRRHEEGTTMMLWTIDLKGHVRDCRIIASSGSKSLDDAACGAITRNGRYKPALDAAGAPIVSHEAQKVIWAIPH